MCWPKTDGRDVDGSYCGQVSIWTDLIVGGSQGGRTPWLPWHDLSNPQVTLDGNNLHPTIDFSQ